MLKKTLVFLNLDDVEVQEDWYFSLTKAELAEQALVFGGVKGDYVTMLRKIITSGDAAIIIKTFKDVLMQSVGRRDGNRFIKNESIRQEFEETGAFSALFMELATDAGAAADFISKVIPSDLAKQVGDDMPKAGIEGVDDLKPDPTDTKALQDLTDDQIRTLLSDEEPEDTRPLWLQEDRKPTKAELMQMSREELKLAYRHILAK